MTHSSVVFVVCWRRSVFASQFGRHTPPWHRRLDFVISPDLTFGYYSCRMSLLLASIPPAARGLLCVLLRDALRCGPELRLVFVRLLPLHVRGQRCNRMQLATDECWMLLKVGDASHHLHAGGLTCPSGTSVMFSGKNMLLSIFKVDRLDFFFSFYY